MIETYVTLISVICTVAFAVLGAGNYKRKVVNYVCFACGIAAAIMFGKSCIAASIVGEGGGINPKADWAFCGLMYLMAIGLFLIIFFVSYNRRSRKIIKKLE